MCCSRILISGGNNCSFQFTLDIILFVKSPPPWTPKTKTDFAKHYCPGDPGAEHKECVDRVLKPVGIKLPLWHPSLLPIVSAGRKSVFNKHHSHHHHPGRSAPSHPQLNDARHRGRCCPRKNGPSFHGFKRSQQDVDLKLRLDNSCPVSTTLRYWTMLHTVCSVHSG